MKKLGIIALVIVGMIFVSLSVANVSAAWNSSLNVGLVAGYNFDGGSISDITGNNHNGSAIGDDFQLGIIGNALNCSGGATKKYGHINDSDNVFDFQGGNFSYSFWAKPEALSPDFVFIAKFSGVGDWSYNMLYSAGELYDDLYMPTNRRIANSTHGMAIGNWSNVIAVFTANGTDSFSKLYINGTLSGELYGIPEDKVVATTANLSFCRDEFGGGRLYFNGQIDEAYLWNRPLTDAEVSNLYNGGVGITYNAGELTPPPNTTLIYPANGSTTNILLVNFTFNITTNATLNATFNLTTPSGITENITNIQIWNQSGLVNKTFVPILTSNFISELFGVPITLANGAYTWFVQTFWHTTSTTTNFNWHRLVIVKNDTQSVHMYIDGVLNKSHNSWSTDFGTSYTILLGKTPNNNYFNGTLDDVAIYKNYAFSQANVTTDWNGGNGTEGGIQTPAPVAYWNFNTTYNDSSGNNHNLTNNGASLIPAKFGNGVSFDGVSSYIEGSSSTDFDFSTGDNFTIVLWVKLDSLFGDYVGLIGTSNTWFQSGAWLLRISAAGQANFMDIGDGINQDGYSFAKNDAYQNRFNYSVSENNTFTQNVTPAPIPNITYPLNTTYNYTVTELNYTVSDAQACWYSTNLGVTNNSITCGNNVTGLTSSSGSNTWIVYANNSEGTLASSSVTFVFEAINISPTTVITYPLNTTYDYNVTELNYSISADGSCWYSLDGGATNQTLACGGNSIPGLTSNEGSNTWTIYANMSNGNTNQSSVTFVVDTTIPGVSITYPQNIAYNYSVDHLNYTVSSGALSCKYTLDNGITNNTITCGNNVTGLTSNEGNNTWTVYAGLNSSSVNFIIDTVGVSFNVSSFTPTNGTKTNNPNQNLSGHFTDSSSGISNITLYVYNQSGLYNVTTQTTFSNIFDVVVGFPIYFVDGAYTWFMKAFDFAGNDPATPNETLEVDTSAPRINITYPINHNNYSYYPNHLNYTVDDLNLDACWWGYTPTANANLTFSNSNSQANHTNYGTITNPEYAWDGDWNTAPGSIQNTSGYIDENWTIPPNTNSAYLTSKIGGSEEWCTGNYWYYYDNNTNTYVAAGSGVPGEYTNLIPAAGVANGVVALRFVIWNGPPGSIGCISQDFYEANVTFVISNFTSMVCGQNLTISSTEGQNSVYLFANDTFGSVSSANVTYFTDTITPVVTLVSPSTSGGTLNNFILINATAIDANLKNLTVYLYNSTYSVLNSNTTTANKLYVNYTLTADGTYYTNATACDYSGHCGYSTTNTITADSVGPIVNLYYPLNQTYIDQGFVVNVTNITTNINWSITETNPGSCWYNLTGPNVFVNCSANTTQVTIPYGSYNLYFSANDTSGHTTTVQTTPTFSYGLHLLNQTNNNTVYDTDTETFFLQINWDNNSYSGITGTLYYDGVAKSTSTTANGNSANFSSTFDIPSVTASTNKTFYWTVGLTNSSGTTDYNGTLNYINVTATSLVICNASNNIPYLNISFKDETTNAPINGLMDQFTATYYLGTGSITKTYIFSNSSVASGAILNGTAVNPNFKFCFDPGNRSLKTNYVILYSSQYTDPISLVVTLYPQRTYTSVLSTLTSVTTNQILPLTGSGNGRYVTFQFISSGNGQGVSGVDVRALRNILGADTLVSQGTTDDTGSITFFLNPNYNHTISGIKVGCSAASYSVTPALSSYTITMSCEASVAPYQPSSEGVKYQRTPSTIQPLNAGNVTFKYYVTSGYSNIKKAKMTLKYNNGTIIATNESIVPTASCSSGACTITLVRNTRPGDNIKGMLYVDTGAGYYLLEGDAYWKFINTSLHIPSTSKGLKLIASDINDIFNSWRCDSMVNGQCVQDNTQPYSDIANRNEFSRIVILFFFMAIILALIGRTTGYDAANPGSFVYLIAIFIILLCGLGGMTGEGLLYYDNLTPWHFLNNYILAITMGLYLLGYYASTIRRYS